MVRYDSNCGLCVTLLNPSSPINSGMMNTTTGGRLRLDILPPSDTGMSSCSYFFGKFKGTRARSLVLLHRRLQLRTTFLKSSRSRIGLRLLSFLSANSWRNSGRLGNSATSCLKMARASAWAASASFGRAVSRSTLPRLKGTWPIPDETRAGWGSRRQPASGGRRRRGRPTPLSPAAWCLGITSQDCCGSSPGPGGRWARWGSRRPVAFESPGPRRGPPPLPSAARCRGAGCPDCWWIPARAWRNSGRLGKSAASCFRMARASTLADSASVQPTCGEEQHAQHVVARGQFLPELGPGGEVGGELLEEGHRPAISVFTVLGTAQNLVHAPHPMVGPRLPRPFLFGSGLLPGQTRRSTGSFCPGSPFAPGAAPSRA